MNRLLPLLFAAMLAACTTTPTAPPVLDLPPPTAGDLRLERWWTAFGDPTLDRLVDEALANNLDLEAALARIDLARSQVLLAQASLYPSVNLGAGASRSRISEVGSQPLFDASPLSSSFNVGIQLSYELDLWGKYRTATAAARAELLASQYAREIIRTAVASQVASTYIQLRAADAELRLLVDTLGTRDETVKLQLDRNQAGVIGDYDLRQAEAERAAVASDVAVVRRAIAQFESGLAALLGRSPREVYQPAIERAQLLDQLSEAPMPPDGLPSEMLERRPDIRRAEMALAAANLRIDVARADYFPQIGLTGSFGSQSATLANLFSGPAAVWSLGAALLQPLIGLKAIESNVEAQTARRNEAVTIYKATVQTAFREAHDALAAHRNMRDAFVAQTERRDKLRGALELADLRYRSGYSPYLEVLDAQRNLLGAESARIIAARDLRVAIVDLYKALGGGWDYRDATAAR